MIKILQELIHYKEPPESNNPETYVLTHNRFNTYMVLFFRHLNKILI